MRLKDLQRKYMLFDADGTGMIDANELGDVLRAVGLNPIESRVLVRPSPTLPAHSCAIYVRHAAELLAPVD